MKTAWEARAKEVEEVYDMPVDWDERFYICPACGEPIYEDDWMGVALEEFICPACEFTGEEG